MNNKKYGISLIVLVITIIVLIILTGVGISTINNGGVLNKATNSTNNSIIASEKEQITIAWSSLKIDVAAKTIESINAENLDAELERNGNPVSVIYNDENHTFTITFSKTNNEYTVDENGNITFNGEGESENQSEYGENPNGLTATDIVNTGNTTEYFGKYVTNYVAPTINEVNYNNYNPTIANDEEKWQIFYIGDAGNGENRIYLISTNYIQYDYVPLSKSGFANTRYSGDYRTSFSANVLNDYSGGTDDISQRTRYLNKQLFDSLTTTNTTNTMKKTAYMCDTNVWSCYANEYADFTIGGPTLELYVKSYNEKYNKEYKELNNKEKYQAILVNYYYYLSIDGGANLHGLASGGAFDITNSLYVINDSNTFGMFLASPEEWSNTSIWTINYNGGYNSYFNNPGDSVCFRPVICLNANVRLEEDGDNYRIADNRPSFTVNTEHLQNENNSISISNIYYVGNANNWQVKYKRSYENNWHTSNNLSFTVNDNGIYNIKIVSGNIESREKKIYVGDYIDLQYIASTGTQYIDTLVPTNTNNLIVELSFQPTGNMNENMVASSLWANQGYLLMLYNGKWRWHTGTGARDLETVDTTKFNYIKTTPEYIQINDNVTNVNSGGFSSNTLKLFGGVTYDSANRNSSGKLEYCKIYSGDTLLRDFIPVYSTAAHSAGLYDNVTETFYENSGTGKFILGPEKIDN